MSKEECVLDAALNFLIPAESAKNLPSGREIFDRTNFLANIPTWFNEGVLKVDEESQRIHSTDFSNLKLTQQQGLLKESQRKFSVLLNNLMIQLIEQYYQSGTVLKGIGYGDRAPFPDGNDIPEGDLTLLESVYEKGRIYKDI